MSAAGFCQIDNEAMPVNRFPFSMDFRHPTTIWHDSFVFAREHKLHN